MSIVVKPEPLPPERWRRRVYPVVATPIRSLAREALAYHEAGHAFFCLRLGIPMIEAVAADDGGEVRLDVDAIRVSPVVDVPAERADAICSELAAMYYAGLQAERLLAGLPFDGVMLPDDSDHRNARTLLHGHFGTVTPLGYAQHRARAVLSRHWREIEPIAAQLLESGRWVPT